MIAFRDALSQLLSCVHFTYCWLWRKVLLVPSSLISRSLRPSACLKFFSISICIFFDPPNLVWWSNGRIFFSNLSIVFSKIRFSPVALLFRPLSQCTVRFLVKLPYHSWNFSPSIFNLSASALVIYLIQILFQSCWYRLCFSMLMHSHSCSLCFLFHVFCFSLRKFDFVWSWN